MHYSALYLKVSNKLRLNRRKVRNTKRDALESKEITVICTLLNNNLHFSSLIVARSINSHETIIYLQSLIERVNNDKNRYKKIMENNLKKIIT